MNVLHFVHGHRSLQTMSVMDMQIKYIKGIDLSPNEVQEARRRFQEMKVKRRNMNRGEQTRNLWQSAINHDNSGRLVLPVFACLT